MSPDLPSPDQLFEHAACGLMLTGADGIIHRVNSTACAWLGYEAEELVGVKRLHDLLTVGGRLFHQTHCLPILQLQGSVAELQLDMCRSDRSRIPVLMNVVRRKTGDQVQDSVAFVTSNDRRAYEHELLKARKTAEAALEERRSIEARLQAMNEQLSRADARKDEFLATLAHELRNPLAPIRSGLELLKMRLPNDSATGRIMDVFDRQLQQMTHLVDDLMDVSRITQGRLRLRARPVNLAATLRAAVADVCDFVDASSHTLTLALDDDTIVVNADATRLTQLIVNLLTNACKYTPAGGRIALSATREGPLAVIRVCDSGIGIEPSELPTIFDMFSQVEAAIDRSRGGLGIGLWLVKRLVELHGGSVSAHSEGPGHGSTFTVRLPTTDALLPSGDDGAPEHASARLRVLLVDDNVDAAEMLGSALAELGHVVCLAHDAASAIASGERFRADAALLDIGLPDMNGYELAQRIRATGWGKDVYLIAVTGWGQDSDKQRAMAAGFNLHLTKPIDLAELQAALGAAGRACSGIPAREAPQAG